MWDAINHEVYDKLSVPDKIRLVQEIWDDIARRPEAVEVPPEVVEEAERRFQEHQRDPSSSLPWDEVRRRIESGE